MESISQKKLEDHLSVLTREIGVRLAGSSEEKRAANYIADQFGDAGALISCETFPVNSLSVQQEHVEIYVQGQWKPFSCSLFSNTPSTNGKVMEAPLVFFEAPAESQRQDLSHLKGKAVVHLGTHIESRQAYQRLIEARPAFLMLVDVRYPGNIPLADSMFPAYANSIGAVPTVNIAYMDAWQWSVSGASRARLTVSGGMVESQSQNIIADFPGRDPEGGLLLLGAHHDTQANSVGADDNGTGVAGLLELARLLAPMRRSAHLRFISFGAEEQLSVGSAHYVRQHRAELKAKGELILNLDSFGSFLGWSCLIVNGPLQLESHIRPFFESQGTYVRFQREIMPYTPITFPLWPPEFPESL